MSEQLNAEMQHQSNIHEITKLLQNWEDATSHAEQGHAVALNHIGNQEVLSRLSQEIQGGDFSELTKNALAVLENMYEEARQSAQERAKGMIQQDADVITNNPGMANTSREP
jgi:CTP-dependent riboflavin kinase